MKVLRIPVKKLHHEEWFNLYTKFKECVERFDAATIGIKALYEQFLPLFDKADKLMVVLSRSVYTKRIGVAGKKRDKFFRGFYSIVKGSLSQPDATKQAAADRLYNLLRVYRKHILLSNFAEESSATYNLLEDLRGKYAADLTTLQLNDWVDAIDRTEQEFLATREERQDESVAKPKENLIQARAQANILYSAMITLLDIRLLADGLGGDVSVDPEDLDNEIREDNDPFTPERHGNIVYNFVIDWNETLKKYHKLLQYRSGRRDKTSAAEAEES
jgi:hypothetical protein